MKFDFLSKRKIVLSISDLCTGLSVHCCVRNRNMPQHAKKQQSCTTQKSSFMGSQHSYKNIKATARVGELNSSFRAFLSLAAFWRKVAPQIKKANISKKRCWRLWPLLLPLLVWQCPIVFQWWPQLTPRLPFMRPGRAQRLFMRTKNLFGVISSESMNIFLLTHKKSKCYTSCITNLTKLGLHSVWLS